CTLLGGGKTSIDRAVLFNTAATRYLDFMDSYMGDDETCHPCDNLAALLSAAELANASGRDLLTALAVSYQIQCRLADEAPVMPADLDHTYHLSFCVPAGAGRLLGMDTEQIANALSIAGSQLGSMAVIRCSPGTELKGLAAAVTSSSAMLATLMARQGVTGPVGVIEAKKGFKDVMKVHLDVDWEKERLDVIQKCSLKSYNAEVHTQSTIDAVLDLLDHHASRAEDVHSVKGEVFRTAYEITGSGDYGNRYLVQNKEQADHSLPYLVAVALLDGEVWPEQFSPERILKKDVQELLRRVYVMVPPPKANEQLINQTDPFTERYPREVCCRVIVRLHDGTELRSERKDYPGFFSRPFDWAEATNKYMRLATTTTDRSIAEEIAGAIRELESIQIGELMALLRRAGAPRPKSRFELR
ncbi:MAG: 2-methylcitrate dehydratase, partial [Fimbriimonadaceae bacterium]|nr:2-methylcitrate dehydratase [Fimbriimonadaceae bacterium]